MDITIKLSKNMGIKQLEKKILDLKDSQKLIRQRINELKKKQKK